MHWKVYIYCSSPLPRNLFLHNNMPQISIILCLLSCWCPCHNNFCYMESFTCTMMCIISYNPNRILIFNYSDKKHMEVFNFHVIGIIYESKDILCIYYLYLRLGTYILNYNMLQYGRRSMTMASIECLFYLYRILYVLSVGPLIFVRYL